MALRDQLDLGIDIINAAEEFVGRWEVGRATATLLLLNGQQELQQSFRLIHRA